MPFESDLLYKIDEDFNKSIKYSQEDIQRDIYQKLPQKFMRRLYHFQKEGIEFAIKQHGRILFGDEMGIGKTI